MKLSNDLISQFAKATMDTTKTITETIVYGTVQEDVSMVLIDGSDTPTPVTTSVVLNKDDRVSILLKNHEAIVTGNTTSPAPRNDDVLDVSKLNAAEARIDKLEAADVTINGTLTAHTGNINDLTANVATINGTLTAAAADIAALKTDKLSATDIEGKYANIDFSNITKATMKEFYAESGIIKDAVLQNGVITGELSGVTISGDLIKANTLIANKLVIKGSNGLYYKLNTDGVTVEKDQTDENSLNGTVIRAKSVTASKINVTDLQAFGATIGGFKISENSVYSGVKSSPTNTTRGIYLGSDGQLFFGDATNYLKYTIDADGNSKLQMAADSITFGANKNLETALADASKSATNFMNLTASDGLIIGDRTGTLGGNIQLKSETTGASVSLRNGTSILAKFISTNKTFTGVTSATTSTSTDTETTEDDSGTTSETTGGSSQTVSIDQSATVTKIESANPVYFSGGVRTDKVIMDGSNFISNTDFTLNGKIFDKDGRSVLDLNTIAGNLTLGYGRFKNATASSNDYTIIYGNKVRLTTKKGAVIALDGSVVLDAKNANGNMVLGYHLYKMKAGDTNIYGGDNINLRGKSVSIMDSTGNACFEAKNDNGNTVIGYARYVNSGNTNIYGGTELNFFAKSGGTIVANSPFVPKSNASLALGKAGTLGWSNIYIGNESGVYNGLRMIVSGSNENLCGRDENGRYIFGNNGSVMYYRAKAVDSTNTGNAFKFTSGNDVASNNTTSVWLFGGADSTSRFIGSYMAYNRTYSSAGNMYVTANGIFGRSTSSSERYKEDITVADLSCFSGLYNLPVKKFKYKSGYLCGEDERCGQYLYGFIAEDLEQILPCAVEHITDQNGETVPEMWNSNIIIPALLKLIQDLNNRLIPITTTVNGKADTSAIPTALSQLSDDPTHRVVTDTEKAAWNAKSGFDGNYNSLSNKPTIPTKTSQLTNNSGFVNSADIQTGVYNYLTTGTTGSGTSGSLKLTLGHTYRLWVVDGIWTYNTFVRLSTDTSKAQSWFLGIGPYGHYMRLGILGNGIVTYSYANVGNTNWIDNTSITIYYEDITGKS